MYIRDLPPEILFNLYRMLDVPGRRNWEQLGMLIGFTTMQIQSFKRLLQTRESPTGEMLKIWGYKNATVSMLYENLAEMKHGQALKLLKPYVDHSLYYKMRDIDGEPLEDTKEPVTGRWGPEPMHNGGGNSLYTPPAQHPVPSPLMTPERGMHEPPSFPQSPGRYTTYDSYGPHSHQPSEYSGGYPSMHPSHHSPRPNYMDSFGKYGPSPAGSRYLPPSMPVSPTRSNIEISRKEQMHFDEQAALAATIHKSYSEIQKATNNFDERNKLGEGSFGKVYLAVIGQTKYAVKVLLQNDHVQVAVRNNQRVDQRKELAALVSYKHPNIVLMCFFSVDGEHPCIIYEYLENGSLEDNLLCKNGRKPLSWEVRQQIAEGSALGINHLHTASSVPLIHGDIKSANILLDKHFEPKLGDFGLARPGPLNGKTCTILKTQYAHGTLPYLPEEFKRNLELSKKVDSFSFGVVLMEILTGERAYDEKREPVRLLSDKVKNETKNDMDGAVALLKDKKCPEWPNELFKEMLVLANRLTSKSRHERPQFDTVLSELNKMNANFGLSTSSEVAHPTPTQNSDPLPDSSTDGSDSCKKPSLDSTTLSEEEERQKVVNEFRKNIDSVKMSMAASTDKAVDEGRPDMRQGPMGQGGPMGHGRYLGQGGYIREGGQGGDRGHVAFMRQNAYIGQNGTHLQPTESDVPLGYGRPTSPYGYMQQSGSRFGYGNRRGSDDRLRQGSPGVGVVSHEGGPYPRDNRPTWGQQEPSKRFPDGYPAEGPMGARCPLIHRGSSYPELSEATNHSMRPSLQKGESEVEQAFREGYQRGFYDAYMQLERSMASLTPQDKFPRDMPSLRQYPSQAPNGTMLPSPNIPNFGQISPMGIGCSFTSDLDRLHAGKSGLENKTDDAKITNTGDLKESSSPKEKSFEDLQSKEISLKDMRSQKEPQQSTEPM